MAKMAYSGHRWLIRRDWKSYGQWAFRDPALSAGDV
jgi:hypothetical protein